MRFILLVLGCNALVILLYSLVGDFVVELVFPDKYKASGGVTLILLFANLFYGVYLVMSPIILFHEKNFLLSVTSLLCLLVLIFAITTTVGNLSLAGVAIAVLVAAFFRVVIVSLFSLVLLKRYI